MRFETSTDKDMISGARAGGGGNTVRMMLGAGLIWLCDIVMQTAVAEIWQQWAQILGRGVIIGLVSIIGLFLVYQNMFNQENETTMNDENDDSEDVAHDNELTLSLKEGPRRLSLRRGSLKLPTINITTHLDNVEQLKTPDWNESQFKTPLPYKTPSPQEYCDKEPSFTNIPIFRS